MKKLIGIAGLMFISASLFAGNVKFTGEDYQDIEKAAKDLIDANMKALKKEGIKKLAILECCGTYVTSKEVTNSVADQRSNNFVFNVRTKTTTLEMDKDFYTNTSNRVYDAVKEAFEANGIAISTKEEINNSERYIEFNLDEEKAGRGVSSGLYKPTVVEKSQKVSTTGLGVFPGAVGMIKVVMNLGYIVADLGADGFVQVNFKVDKSKDDQPILTEFNMLLSSNIKETEVGFKGNKKMRYDFMNQWQPIVTLKAPLESEDEVMDGKKGPFNVTKYDKALMDMLYAITDATKVSISKALVK